MTTEPDSNERWADIGRLRAVPLREVWAHEAHDFTVWLEENVDVVGDQIGMMITDVRREVAAGTFSVDLVGTDQLDRTVVIENQLEKSDHDHLGKLITYLAVHDASVAIWIVREPRPEHVAAVTWLNKSRDVSFYLFKLEAFRIGDSAAAPLLTLITQPTEELREAGDQQRERTERGDNRHRFWSQLLASAGSEPHPHGNVSPSVYNWIDGRSGISGVVFQHRVRKNGAGIGLVLQTDDQQHNEALFDGLFAQRDTIEEAYGAPLRWERKPETKKCEIVAEEWSVGLDHEAEWPTLQQAMLRSIRRLNDALRAPLAALR